MINYPFHFIHMNLEIKIKDKIQQFICYLPNCGMMWTINSLRKSHMYVCVCVCVYLLGLPFLYLSAPPLSPLLHTVPSALCFFFPSPDVKGKLCRLVYFSLTFIFKPKGNSENDNHFILLILHKDYKQPHTLHTHTTTDTSILN